MKINLPAIITVDDYHEFGYIADTLKQFGANVDFEELTDNKFGYRAVFFEKGNSKGLKKFLEEYRKKESK